MPERSKYGFSAFFKPMPLSRALPAVLIILLLLFIVDYFTGYEISFSIFYLIPVTLAVLLHGRNLGIAVSVLSALAWIGAMVFSVLPSTIGPMLKNVDDLMYEVKSSGKNNLKIVRQYE